MTQAEHGKMKGLFREILLELRQHLPKFYIFMIVILLLWIVFAFLFIFTSFNFFEWFIHLPLINNVLGYIDKLLAQKNYLGVTVYFFFTGIFFFPTPIEPSYIAFLVQGFSFPQLYIATLIGLIIAQHVNFFIGKSMGKRIHGHFKKETIERYQGWIGQYSAYVIFALHVVPLPYTLLNFTVGLTEYPYWKWVLVVIPALMVNFVLCYLFFVLVF